MKFLGVEILQSIISFFESVKDAISLEYLFYIFIGVEILSIIIFIVITHFVYELRLMRIVDKLNAYLYQVQYIDDSNLIEFNNMMKGVPKTLRYHWQQYMLYREKAPSYYMSVENCIDRPIKASAFAAVMKIVKTLGYIYTIVALIFSFGWATGFTTVTPLYFLNIFSIPLIILFMNYLFLIGLHARSASNTSDLYQTFHIFNRFIDKAVSTMPEYVDFEVLFTRKEIKRGIPVLNEYIEKRQIQEQEEMRKAKENAVQHELYDFETVGEKGELVLERAMRETEILVNLKNRLNAEIEQIEKEVDSVKRTYENASKDYQKKLQASKENVDRLREQQESTTNRIESNYIRKQQSDEIKKQEQIEKEQDDATLRYNQEINTLTTEIKKRKEEIEEGRKNAEKAMLSEYKTFANKIFTDVKSEVNSRIKNEKDELINTRESMARELEESLIKIDQFEKQNKVLVSKSKEREDFIKAEIGKENERLLEKIAKLQEVISEKDQHISLISENPKLKIKEKKFEFKKEEVKPEVKSGKKLVVEGEFSFDDKNSKEEKTEIETIGKYDSKGNYRFENGTYYDPDGCFHDENGNVFDKEGNIINTKTPQKSPLITPKLIKEETEEEVEEKVEEEIKGIDELDEFDGFDIDDDEEVVITPKEEAKTPINDLEIEWGDGEEEITEEKVKGKRGRPRKEVPNVEDKPKGKRGRPRKEVKEEDLKPKGKRGRPRKEITGDVEEKPKGKRGRPRKEGVQINPTKGKRGRPKKQGSEVEVKPKGKRGRPKKIDIDDLKEIEKKIKEQNNILKGQQEDLKKVVKKATKK